ncbi:hypothetical protein [Aminobacter aminovorans]|uniref:Uncharacterized protein n=1 Tax=Aminobacter aminovorans TaxID=83263 RepID=A0ABR6HAE0_AMIAI|nr:hypothetical protein [Aminobacter aminovorans]MBB3707496.1 hypothetical protein [Aminobacter aminovorans]
MATRKVVRALDATHIKAAKMAIMSRTNAASPSGPLRKSTGRVAT